MNIKSVSIGNFKPFWDFKAEFGNIEVIAGANGSSKTSLLDFMKFIRNSMRQEIPPEIIPGPTGQQVFHSSEKKSLAWTFTFICPEERILNYYGSIFAPPGQPSILIEEVSSGQDEKYLNVRRTRGYSGEIKEFSKNIKEEINFRKDNQLALGLMTNPNYSTLYELREYIESWRFFSSFNISNEKIRIPALIEQNPILREDCGNLSSVLFYLFTQHRDSFEELQEHLRKAVSGFENIIIKARGAPGEVLAFWKEKGVDNELTLADLSDGILRLLCWMVLCVHPEPLSLICIDEPELGVHPRTLPILVGLFEKASKKTQILIATHSSYFLSQFNVENIAVMTKKDGEAIFLKPKDSKTLIT